MGKQRRTQRPFILLDDLVWGWLLFGGGLYSRKYGTFTCTCTCKCWILAIPRCWTYNCTFLWTVSTRLSTNKWYCLSHWKRLWMSSRFHLELGVTNVFGGVWPTGLFVYSNTCMRFTMYLCNLTRLGISAFIWGIGTWRWINKVFWWLSWRRKSDSIPGT